MKKLLLLAACAAGLLAARPAAAQYFVVASPNAGQNPSNLNTDGEYPVGGGLPADWTTLFTGTAGSFATPVWTSPVTLPFSFQFNGQAVTSCQVATSGVLTFTTTATAVPPAANTALPSASIPDKSICVWGLGANTGDFIATKTFGTAPNRQFWVLFDSYSKPGNTAVSWTYWSIVLEETTNNIYVVDQRTYGSNATALTVGVQVNATTAVQVAPSPAVASLTTNDPTPADNSYYRFSPGTAPARDLYLRSLNIPAIVSRGVSVPVRGQLENQGSQTVTSYSVNYKVGSGAAVTAPVTGVSVASNSRANFTHPTAWTPAALGTYPLKVWLSNPNGQPDQRPANDTLRTTVSVEEDSLRHFVVEECFTSSTCPPCVAGNIIVENVNAANQGKQVVIKYQQNFPSPGTDPYYTTEGGARRGYYGINAIPYMTLDGGWNQNSQSFTAAILNQFRATPVTMRIKGTYSLTNNGTTKMVAANAFVRPYVAYPAGQLVAHMVITERHTVLNARTNGETNFFHVMKKMLPNSSGTPLPALAAGQAFTLSQVFDVATLPTAQAVEHFDSLQVVVFVQNVASKTIYQGADLTLSSPLATQPGATQVAASQTFFLAPNPANGRQTMLLFDTERPTTARIEVLDALGRPVLTRPEIRLGAGSQGVQLDLPITTAAGLYLVRLTTSAGVSTQRLTLE